MLNSLRVGLITVLVLGGGYITIFLLIFLEIVPRPGIVYHGSKGGVLAFLGNLQTQTQEHGEKAVKFTGSPGINSFPKTVRG